MKKLYRKLIRSLENIAVRVERRKTLIAERIAIRRKKKLYNHIKWSKEQKQEYKEYWKKHYGKVFSNRWHRLYQASNGVFRVDYMPEILYSTKIEQKLNDYKHIGVLSNKSFTPVLFDSRISGVRTPKTFAFRSNGQCYDSERRLVSLEDAATLLCDAGVCVIKPTVDSSSGHGVRFLNLRDGKDVKTGEAVLDILSSSGDNFIVQEKIKQHEKLAALHPSSLNTIRVITYVCDNSIYITPISVRVGGGGSEVDNIHAGGISIGANDDGSLLTYAYRLGYGDSFEKFDVHPDTKIRFDGYKLDFMPKVVEVAKSLHTMTTNIGMISWDFSVDDQDNVIVIETNLRGQSVWFPQMLSGRALFGENTPKMLSLIKK
ncbi:MAG: hypothetical protein J6V09_01880 [Clostridia bacterium]|nr:hypothetical protein [Clostridia bacterium]